MTDWGIGEYERTAAVLQPAADAAVAALAPQPGERVLDVGCGTGNAALRCAEAGADVVGLDLAPRLVDVAAARVPGARFVVGDAAALPFADGEFDAALSVFGVIFAEIRAAASELVRVVRDGGRVVVTTWVPKGPSSRVATVVGAALGAPQRPPTWSDPAVVREAFAPHAVAFDERAIPFAAASVDAYLEQQTYQHPLYLAAEGPLRERGRLEDVRAQIRDLFAADNEDPAAFRTTSRYWIATVSV